jgi:AcrR family transcriptional regulator
MPKRTRASHKSKSKHRTNHPYHHGDLRDALIALALETLEEHGPEALTLRDLAERAGVSGMAPYRHFADKTALLRAVAAHGFAILKEQFKAVDDPDHPAKALEQFGAVYVRFALERPGLFRLMFDGQPLLTVEELDADPENSYGLLRRRIGQVVPGEHRTLALVAFQALAHGFCVLLANGRLRRIGALDARRLVPGLTTILLRGLASDPLS